MKRSLFLLCILVILTATSCSEREFKNPAEPHLIMENLKAPVNLQISVADENVLQLTWEDVCEAEEGFQIHRKKNAESYALYKTLPANSTQWQDNNVSLGNNYSYKIYAVNEEYRSKNAIESTFVYKLMPPANFTIEASSDTKIKLSWDDNNHFEQGYKIERKLAGYAWQEGFATVAENATSWEYIIDEPNSTAMTWRVKAYYKSLHSENSSEAGLKVSDPVFSLAGGTFSSAQSVSISCATIGAKIRYTTDGSTPTASSTLYSGALQLDENTALKAKAFVSGWQESEISAANYIFIVSTPTFSVAGGSYTVAKTVTISCATSGATIRYTTDGSTPSTSSPLYSEAILLDTDTTLKAKAYKNGWTNSETSTSTYVINIPTVATPSFSPAGGNYNNNQSVTISCATSGATIRYTTDGSTPTSTSAAYSSAITVNVPSTLKAKAFKTDWIDSSTANASYSFVVATPTLSPAGGTYNNNQNVTISCATSGATIRYTTDGSTPTSSSTVYSSALPINANTTLKAKAFRNNWIDSSTANANYILKVATPSFSIAGGTYTSSQSVIISCATSGATIRYTTDGSTPTSTSTVYSGAIWISVNTTLKAKAFKSDWTDSEIATSSYVINLPTVATPTFSPAGGTYNNNQSVTISCATSGASIRYTTDGSTPTSSSTVYSSALPINVASTLKAKAFKHDWIDSSIASASYNFQVATPTLSPAGGTYNNNQSVTISCATSGATIRYTTDGSTPTSSSTVYSSALPINVASTLKAKAFKHDWIDSSTANASYNFQVATPVFSPSGGTYSSSQSVTISCATSGATIYYTTDGSTPTSSSTVYSSAIPISANIALKAKAFRNNWTDSSTASANYILKVATPSLSIAGGTYASSQSVSISCATSGATIYYTTDGSTPTSSSTVYSSAISISANTTLKAKAFKSDWTDSEIASASYSLKVSTPTFNPAGGAFITSQSVSISCATSGATIYYTTDGSTPTSTSAVYSSAITISVSTTLNAKAFKSGWTDSETADASYIFDMVYVPGGTFTMGDTRGQGSSDELPTHSVTLNSFLIGKYQVTQGEYQAVMGSNPASSYGVGSNYPVYYVSWYDAITYCNLRSINEGLTPVYSISGSTNPANWGSIPSSDNATWNAAICNWNANGYRLPTEAEWEYAARGATNSPDYLYSGSDTIGNVAWYDGNSGGSTHPVGGKAPNGLGIYDMSGNVWEWCWDWWDASYYSSSPSNNPKGPASGTRRVLRGGSWYDNDYCRVASATAILLLLGTTILAFGLSGL